MKPIVRRVVIGLGTLVVLAVGIRLAMVWNNTRDVLPAFSSVPAGPRMPAPMPVMGFTVGRSTLAEVQAVTTSFGFDCRDASMRGLMAQGRQETQAKMKAAEDAGDDPDAVSGASRANYHSKKERNPQVQWSCEDIDLSRFPGGTGYAAGQRGTALFIFDSAAHPLRYVVVSQRFQSQKAALAARDAALQRMAVLGPPTKVSGAPNLDPTQKAFARMAVVSSTWSFVDRKAAVTVMNRGLPKGISVREVVEVPWPVEVTPPAVQ